MTYDVLFQPLQIGDVELKNRLAMAPMNMTYCAPNGYISDQSIAWYATRARGGFGLIITECMVMNPHRWRGCDSLNPALITDQRYYRQLNKLVEYIHTYDKTKIFIQMSPGWGRQGHPAHETPDVPSAAPSCIPMQVDIRTLNKGWERQIKRVAPQILDLVGGDMDTLRNMNDEEYANLENVLSEALEKDAPELLHVVYGDMPREITVDEIMDLENRMVLQAEAESKAVNKYLASENDRFVIDLCESAFGWNVESTGTPSQRAKLPLTLRSFDFRIRFEDFLEVAPTFHTEKWKLINRHLDSGWVPVRKSEIHRLMSGKFKRLILDSHLDVPTLPRRLTEAVERIESELRGKIRRTEPVKITESSASAFPPCIAQIHEDSLAGKNVSHEARFALAAFLLKIGMDIKEVMGVFRTAPDFVQTLAEYQVRHISSKSSGEGYTPPGCRKMQGNSLCPVYLGELFDSLCEYVLHPLAFYQTRAWEVSKGIGDHGWYLKKKRKRQSFR